MNGLSHTPRFNWCDLVAVAIFAAVTYLLWAFAELYRLTAAAHPYLVGFCVFAALSTFGEMLSRRIINGGWAIDHLFGRSILWGAVGVWISAAFPFEAGGVQTLADAGLWLPIPVALSISLWANILSGYGFTMMLTHFWLEKIIVGSWVAPWMIFRDDDFLPWVKVVMISLVVFWVPAHCVTFLLPPSWRSVFAAYLGIALGAVLTAAKARNPLMLELPDVEEARMAEPTQAQP